MKKQYVIFLISVLLFAIVAGITGCGGGGSTGILPVSNPTSPSSNTPATGENTPTPTILPGATYTPLPTGQTLFTVKPPSDIPLLSLKVISEDNPIITPSENGDFTLTIPGDKATIITVMFPDKPFAYMVVTTGETSSNILIDETTTAEAMLFMSPLLFNSDLKKAEIILNNIRNNPNFQNLVSIIKTIYKNSEPLKTEIFDTAYKNTLFSIANSLSSSSIPTLPEYRENTPSLISLSSEDFDRTAKNISLYYTSLNISQEGNIYKIKIADGDPMPIAWIANVAEVKITDFPNQDINRAENYKVYNRISGSLDEPLNFSGNYSAEFGQLIDVLKLEIFKWSLDAIGIKLKYEDYIPIPADREGTYVVRIYNGLWWKVPKEELNFINQIPSGSDYSNKAYKNNIFLITFDFIDIFLGLKEIKEMLGGESFLFFKEMILGVVKDTVKEIEDKAPQSPEEFLKIILNLQTIVFERGKALLLKIGADKIVSDFLDAKLTLLMKSSGGLEAIKTVPRISHWMERNAVFYLISKSLETAFIQVKENTLWIEIIEPTQNITNNSALNIIGRVHCSNISTIANKEATITVNGSTTYNASLSNTGDFHQSVTLKPGKNDIEIAVTSSTLGYYFIPFSVTYSNDPNTGNWTVTVD